MDRLITTGNQEYQGIGLLLCSAAVTAWYRWRWLDPSHLRFLSVLMASGFYVIDS